MTTLDNETSYTQLVKEYGGIRPAARALGIPYSTLHGRLKTEHLSSFVSREIGPPVRYELPENGTRYFILTAAQDCTAIHQDFWNNLNAYAEWLGDCEIIVSGFTYGKGLFEEHAADSGQWWHPDLVPHMHNARIELADLVVFAGEMNCLPTATNPLSGFEAYTRDKWGVFPHAKVALQSIPTAKMDAPKHIMTTGAVTLPNYVLKNAGIKASFHHTIGAVVVEICDDGTFFCRHIQAEALKDDGSFYDLDRYITNGEVIEQVAVEALTYGDIHFEKLDPVVALTTWDYDVETGQRFDHYGIEHAPCLVDYLSPNHQFFHDLSDFAPRNHHNIHDPHFRFLKHGKEEDNVERALRGCSQFLTETYRPFTKSVVVQSNHDNALTRWLKEADYKYDPENAIFFLRTQLMYYEYLAEGISSPPIFEEVLSQLNTDPTFNKIKFVSEDDSYVIAGDIECAMHGHLGANGSRGSARLFSKYLRKSNTGHSHCATIVDGAYVAGVSGRLDQGYNKGMSGWSHSHIVTYANGSRAILTMNNGRWYA